MLNREKFFSFAKKNLIFALPIVAGQIGQMLFGVADVFVAGHHSNEALAALGLSSGLMSPAFMFGIGALNAVGPLSAHDKGKGIEGHHFFPAAILSALCLGLVVWPVTVLMLNFYNVIGLNPDLLPYVRDYLTLCAPSIVFAFLFQASKEYLQAHGHNIFANVSILFFNFLNLALNFLFMFGKGPIPPMGVKGLALATFLTRLLMAIVVFLYVVKIFGLNKKFLFTVDKKSIKAIFKLGSPLGLGVLTEVLVFCTVTLLIGKMETIFSAAHNLVLTLASLTFMLPLALSSAASVKVAHSKGEGDFEGIFYNSFTCAAISVVFMMLTATTYFLFPTHIVGLYTQDLQLIAVASSLLFYVGLFQIPDGLQITLWGSLRGLGIARAPLIMCLLCHWLIGLPLGYQLAFRYSMKAQGLWLGLTIGLSTLALGLILSWKRALRQTRGALDKVPVISSAEAHH
ncbi:MAG: MATE family efflux transporter [Bdellovibrio sp.]|nr:MATE family efflux transporter [Bdellovibrio sp.]